MNDRLLNFLGLCKRAGYLISGADTVIRAIRERKALLVLIAADQSPNSTKNVLFAAEQAGVTVKTLDRSKEELSFALGKHCGIICVTDRGFADKLLTMIELSEEPHI